MATEELSNTAKVYRGLHDAMMDNFFGEKHAQADKIAHSLLLNADLPAVIRAQCHMILATGDETFLEHAKAAVDVLEKLKARDLVVDEAFPHDMLEEAKSIYKAAQEDEEKMKEEMAAKVGEGDDIDTGGMSKADEEAIKAAMMGDDGGDGKDKRATETKYGLATPGVTRNTTRESRRTSRKSSQPKRYGFDE